MQPIRFHARVIASPFLFAMLVASACGGAVAGSEDGAAADAGAGGAGGSAASPGGGTSTASPGTGRGPAGSPPSDARPSESASVYYPDGGLKRPTAFDAGSSVTVLATSKDPFGQGDVFGIATDATSIYWTLRRSTGAVMRMPKAGGAATELIELDSPGPLVVDATNAYVGTPEGLIRVSLADGAKTLVDPKGELVLVQDATRLFYVSDVIAQTSKTGGPPLSLDFGFPEPVQGLAVTSTDVYWGGPTKVYSVPIGGGSVRTIASGQNGTAGVVVDANRVYWISANTVCAAPLSGGAVTVLATGQATPFSLALDGTTLYWTSFDGYRIAKMNVAGGEVTTVAFPVDRPTNIVVDGDFAYWVTRAGQVMRAPK